MLGNNYLLWENDDFMIKTPFNPHTPYAEGPILVVAPKADGILNAWQDSDVTAEAFRLAAKACALMEQIQFAPWFNLQANGNWGLLEGATPFFHLYIYGRNQTSTWAKPLILPERPGTYKNDPMPEHDRQTLTELFAKGL